MEKNLVSQDADAEFDTRAFRRALGNFVTGITIATAIDAMGRPRGLTVNSFTSVSLAPPMILVCIANSSACYEVFHHTNNFAVNILSEDQRTISDLFASKATDKFDHVSWSVDPGDAPQIHGSLAVFQCHIENRVQAGDHVILLGRVRHFDVNARRPLVYAQGGYMSVSAQHAAVSRAPGHTVLVSCIAERDGGILMVRNVEGRWELPSAKLAEPMDQLSSLTEALKKTGAKVEITFLYSVFENPTQTLNIVYRGTLAELDAQTDAVSIRDEATMPWRELNPPPLEGMLRRFFRERELDQFGVYADVATPALVARVGTVPEIWESYVSHLTKE
ncbi:MAG: flavin reductase [Rhodospirillaceae bacterium]|nr:MAG: flavin reductase [Rhodospirillaceae bacterium]